MSRTKKSKPHITKEFWSKRPYSNKNGAPTGKLSKKITHSKERMAAKEEILKAPREPEYDEREYVPNEVFEEEFE